MTNYVNDAFEMGRIDQMAVVDTYGWWTNEKGIGLDLLDKESRIEWMRNSIIADRRRHRNRWNRNEFCKKEGEWYRCSQEAYNVEKDISRRIQELKDLIEDTDKSFGNYMDESDFIREQTKGEILMEYLAVEVPKRDLGTLAFWEDRLSEMLANKEINMATFFRAQLLIVDKLADHTQNAYFVPMVSRRGKPFYKFRGIEWKKLAESLVHKISCMGSKSPGYDDRFYGEMSFDMESALDLKRDAERMSMQHNITLTEAAAMLIDQQEELEGVKEGIEEALPQEEVDQLSDIVAGIVLEEREVA